MSAFVLCWRSITQRSRSRFQSKWFWAVVVVTVIGLGLRTYRLGSGSLWYDEAFSALAAERSFSDMIEATANDVHPPLYYAILWGWVRLWPDAGRPSETWLRLPSLLFSVLAIPLTFSFARGFIMERKTALLAAVLMALLPYQIFYGQETRQYSLLLFASLLTVVFWQRKWWHGMCVGLIICAYTHNLGAIWAVTFVLLALIVDWENRKRILWSGYGAGLAYLPWAIRLMTQLAQWGAVGYWLPPVTFGGFLYPFHALLWSTHTNNAVALPGMLLSAALFIISLSLVKSGWKMKTHIPDVIWMLPELLLAPPFLIAAISILKQPIYLARGLIMITPAFYTMIALSLLTAAKQPRRILSIVLVATLIVSLWSYYFDPRLQKWDHEKYSSVISDSWRDGDAVLCAAKCLPFMWYLDKPVITLPTPPDDELHCILAPGTLAALDIQEAEPEQITGYRRLWFVWTIDPSTTQYHLDQQKKLDAHYPTLFNHQFIFSRLAEGTITLYDMETTWTTWTD